MKYSVLFSILFYSFYFISSHCIPFIIPNTQTKSVTPDIENPKPNQRSRVKEFRVPEAARMLHTSVYRGFNSADGETLCPDVASWCRDQEGERVMLLTLRAHACTHTHTCTESHTTRSARQESVFIAHVSRPDENAINGCSLKSFHGKENLLVLKAIIWGRV